MNNYLVKTQKLEFVNVLHIRKLQITYFLTFLFLLNFSLLAQKNSSHLFPVRVDQKWGYINSKGKKIIEVNYELALPFSDGYAMIKQNGELAIINPKGEKILIPESNYSVQKYVIEGMLAYRCKHGDGFYHMKNAEYKAPKYAFVCPYAEGMASFKDKQSGLFGFIDKKGKIKIQAQFEAVGKFNESRCPVRYNGKWTIIDKSGKLKCLNKYTYIRGYSEGLAGTWKYSKNVEYINKKMEIIFKHQIFANLNNLPKSFSLPFYDFSNGLVKVIDYNSGLFGYKDKKGEIVIRYQYKEANDFKEGLACVKYGNKYGFVNKKGKMKIQAQFDFAEDFTNGLAAIYKGGNAKDFKENKEGVSMGYINKKGNIIWNYNR
jgi:hypothetical protein